MFGRKDISIFLATGLATAFCSVNAFAQTVTIPTINSTSADPTIKIKSLGATIAQDILILVTVITAIMLAVALAFLAANKPIPKMFVTPLFAGLGATSFGWLLALVFS